MASASAPKAGIPRIAIPFAQAVSRYGVYVAEVMRQLANARAKTAEGKQAKDFTWSIDYDQGSDPPVVSDEDSFVEHLQRNSQVYLVARGHHWKGWAVLEETPQVVRVKFEERARLVCGMRNKESDDFDAVESIPKPSETTNQDLMDVFNDWMKTRPYADKHLARVIEVGLNELFESNRKLQANAATMVPINR